MVSFAEYFCAHHDAVINDSGAHRPLSIQGTQLSA